MRLGYRLEEFKAFADTGEIQIAPITLLCGANSSGKSSILKSLLLIKQSTVERRSQLIKEQTSPPLLFNGEWTRLGSYSDTVHLKERGSSIRFTWHAVGKWSEISREIPSYIRRTARHSDREIDAKLTTEFRSDPSAREEVGTYLASCSATIDSLKIDVTSVSANLARVGFYRLSLSDLSLLIGRPDSYVRRFASKEMGELLKALSTRTLPVEMGNVKLRLSGPFVVDIEVVQDGSWLPFFNALLTTAIAERVGKLGRTPTWYLELHNTLTELRSTFKQGSGRVASPTTRISRIFDLVEDILRDVVILLSATRVSFLPLWRQIRYLGPLRHQPQRYYQFDDTGGVDIGVSGEFTVQVLALEASNPVENTLINDTLGGTIQVAETTDQTLLEATNYWLDRLGLPPVAPEALRQSLYEMKVGALGVALPDVGFGVSQVLPIIVESLRASKGDTVILEQPEIHLHPRVQAGLGDFLLARAVDGIRFIVETHSDVMIKRLCRRVSENTIPAINSTVAIYFVEEGEGFNPTCRKVTLNDFGEIENWPRGFFDDQEDLYWTNAALKRRKAARAGRAPNA